jgi:hypothetical protein
MNEDIKKLKEVFSKADATYTTDKSKTFWVDVDNLTQEDVDNYLETIQNNWNNWNTDDNGLVVGSIVYPTNLPNTSPFSPFYPNTSPVYYPDTTNPKLVPPGYSHPTTTSTKPEITTEKKDGNPKNSVGSTKFALSVVPTTVTAEVGLGMLEGARKYGRHNWRDEGALASIYWDAACRHLIKWYEGEDIDPDSGLSHITKAICSLYVLRDAMITNVMTDDRPPRAPEKWYEDLDASVKFILEKYPDAKPAHTEKGGADE